MKIPFRKKKNSKKKKITQEDVEKLKNIGKTNSSSNHVIIGV